MAGTTTRYGFAPGDRPAARADSGAEETAQDVRHARTVFGRDAPSAPVVPQAGPEKAPATVAGMAATTPADKESPGESRPPAAAPTAMPGRIGSVVHEAEDLPADFGATGKSGFPAIARLFGRWNTRGDFASDDNWDVDTQILPHRRVLRSALLLILVAGLSFLAVVGVMKLRGSAGAASGTAPAATPTPAPCCEPRAGTIDPRRAAAATAPAPVRGAEVPAPAEAASVPAPAPARVARATGSSSDRSSERSSGKSSRPAAATPAASPAHVAPARQGAGARAARVPRRDPDAVLPPKY